jgi:glycosyltransferase involved in cell wall biosynthesis
MGDALRSARVGFAESLRARMAGMEVSVLGHFAPEAMPEIYHLGDLLVIPSRFEEPFSMVAIEAMASGLPVLALRKGGMKEYMIDGENAFLLPAEADSTALARAIETVADASPEGLAQVARTARTMVESRYTWAHVVRDTERLYREMLQ